MIDPVFGNLKGRCSRIRSPLAQLAGDKSFQTMFSFLDVAEGKLVLPLGVFQHLRILLRRPLTEDGAPDPHLVTALAYRALEVLTHAHAQLQLVHLQAEFLRHPVPGLAQRDEILVLSLCGRRPRPRYRPDGHQPLEAQMRAFVLDVPGQVEEFSRLRLEPGFGVFAGRVYLDEDAERLSVVVLTI